VTLNKPVAFDAEASARVERIYQNPDIVAQRAFLRAHLPIEMGSNVVDVGAGPGLLAKEIADDIGPNGHVIALDPSADMRAIAATRCRDFDNIEVMDGEATALPLDDESQDVLIATQVLEYVSDVEGALREASRVLKPGGRIAVLDTEWESAITRSSDSARTRMVFDAWRNHFVQPDLPVRLPSLLEAARFTELRTAGTAIINTAMSSTTYAGEVLNSIAKYIDRKSLVPAGVGAAWLEEMRSLDASGDFFFSVTRYLFIAQKAA